MIFQIIFILLMYTIFRLADKAVPPEAMWFFSCTLFAAAMNDLIVTIKKLIAK